MKTVSDHNALQDDLYRSLIALHFNCNFDHSSEVILSYFFLICVNSLHFVEFPFLTLVSLHGQYLVNKRLDEWVTEERMDIAKLVQPSKEAKTPKKEGVKSGTESRPSSPEREVVSTVGLIHSL